MCAAFDVSLIYLLLDMHTICVYVGVELCIYIHSIKCIYAVRQEGERGRGVGRRGIQIVREKGREKENESR